MAYILGIDVGTTYSAAAVCRDGRSQIVSVGTRTAAIPSVVVLHPHGEVLVGEAAERRSLSEPTRTAREFKRRLGDPVPILLGGEPYAAEVLMGHVVRHLVERVVELEGAAPAFTMMSHPANYGDFKVGLLREAVRVADVGEVRFITEPEAAAVHYASLARVAEGEVVAVYDFGGGTLDAAVVRNTSGRFTLIGTPEGMERLGGIDFDQAVFAHVVDSLGGLLEELDPADPASVTAVGRMREDCRQAKEALSTDTDVTIPVLLPNAQTEVRLTRPEFEAMIRPRLTETTDALARTVQSAGLTMADVSRVLLVGGSSRIPLVAEVVREATGRDVAVDAHPKHAIAVGAAAAGGADLGASPLDSTASEVAEITRAAPGPSPVAAPAVPKSRRKVPLLVGAVLVAVVVVAAAALALGGGGSGGGSAPSATSTSRSGGAATTALPVAYPAGSTDRFKDFCGDQGVPEPVCSCAIDALKNDKTYPEFVAMESKVYADPKAPLPSDVAAIFERCSKGES